MTVVGLLAKRFADAKKEAEELAKIPGEIQEFEGTEKLVKEYEKLSAKIDKTEEETARLVDVRRQLADQFPGIIENMDAEGNVMEINNELLRESIKLKREEIELKKQDLAEAFGEGVASKDIEKTLDQIKEYEQELEKIKQAQSTFNRDAFPSWFPDWALGLSKGDLEVRQEINQLQQDIIPYNRAWDDAATALLIPAKHSEN